MDDPELDAFLRRFDEEVSKPLSVWLDMRQAYLRTQPITVFNAFVQALFHDAYAALTAQTSVSRAHDIPYRAAFQALFSIAACFNEVLSLDYPYCVGVLKRPGHGPFGPASFRRSRFPELWKNRDPRAVPFITLTDNASAGALPLRVADTFDVRSLLPAPPEGETL